MDKKTEKQYMEEIESLKRTNELYLTIMDSVSQYIFAIDKNDTIILFNKRAEEVEGFHRSEILGRDEKEVYNKDPIPWSTLVTEKIKKSQKPIMNQSYTFHAPDGKCIHAFLDVYPFLYNNEYAGQYIVGHTLHQSIKVVNYLQEAQNKFYSVHNDQEIPKINHTLDDIICSNKKMKEAIALAKRTAIYDSSVMIIGETGCGKELFAQGIHVASMRKGPFVPINCAAIPENLLESTFFGTVKGAFTGAMDSTGLFEQAENGTIFLDEINSMPEVFQAKLLRAIQEKKIRRVGSPKETEFNCRIICATNTDLWKEPQGFRSDLFFRLSVVTFHIPALRDRREDIILLAKYFLERLNKTFHTEVTEISDELMQIFYTYDWPGNVRELENILESAMNFVEEGCTTLQLEHFPEYYRNRFFKPAVHTSKNEHTQLPLRQAIKNYEKNYIIVALEECQWNISKAAEQLGMQRPNLYTKMKEYNIKRPKE